MVIWFCCLSLLFRACIRLSSLLKSCCLHQQIAEQRQSLTEWFNEDERPSKEAMNQFTDILNIPRQMASIRFLTHESIYFWSKNQRSKKRKAESSLLEPWEPCNKNESVLAKPKVTMAIAPYATVTTGSTSTIVSRPQVTVEIQEGSGTPISIAITIHKSKW